jgi:multimeric flavodoxin WrbA
MAPRKSTSEEALRFALDYAHSVFEAETVMIKLRELNFKHCEGYYSKKANACIFPCSISEVDKEDQMLEIYNRNYSMGRYCINCYTYTMGKC